MLNNGTNADIIATNVGHRFLAETPEAFLYDDDGSLTNDGRESWMEEWAASTAADEKAQNIVVDLHPCRNCRLPPVGIRL